MTKKTRTTYRLVEAPSFDCVQETDHLFRCQAERHLAERRADLEAEGYVASSTSNSLVCRLTLVAPDGEKETVRLFIEALTPLTLTDVTDYTPAQMAEYLGLDLAPTLSEVRDLNDGRIYE